MSPGESADDRERRAAVDRASAPIRVYPQDGKWVVDYGSYANGYHVTRDEAVRTATLAARKEERTVVVEDDA